MYLDEAGGVSTLNAHSPYNSRMTTRPVAIRALLMACALAWVAAWTAMSTSGCRSSVPLMAGVPERVESLGGMFQVESSPGQGTKIIANLSLQEEEEHEEE